jgi:hypothetical protein
VSVGAAACSSDTNTPTGGRQQIGDAATDGSNQGGDGGSAMALYGAPAAGGQPGAGGALQNGDGGSIQALYGAPAAGGTKGSGGEMAVPAYGAPFPTGGAANADNGGSVNTGGQGGGFAALYGVPPTP